ncbi:MAG: pectinacetylesterase family protein [Rubrivivax sp.]|jgi:hypothetical protein|nr:pectinacetylesterase family protein [Rubrivivax sp.]
MTSRLRTFAAWPVAALLALLAVAAHARPPAEGGWIKIENPPPITVGGKTYTPSCSGYPGTDPRFSFWARRGTSKNLMVYFEGGGACWDSFSCTFPIAGLPPQVPQLFVPQIAPDTDPARIGGIFDTTRVDNPVRDWNIVYIPYCTGDLHGGSATRTYANVGHPVFPLPSTFEIQHRGFDNFMVALDWMKKNLDKPRRLLVTGVSAGGYGATFNAPWLARAYRTAQISVLADASQGVTTPAFDAGLPGRGSWNLQFEPRVFPDGTSIAGNDFARRLAEGLPRAKVAQFTTTSDLVQIQFYDLIRQFYPPGGSCPDPSVDWTRQMTDKVQSDAASTPNFRFYIASGTYHTLLRDDLFYDEASPGIRFADWLGLMLSNRGGTQGQGGRWFNVACPDCLVPVSCP